MDLLPDCTRQAAVIPVRSGRVCLVLSSSGKRWVVPKGCIKAGQAPGETALQEAWEEAGLTGVLWRKPVGSYFYEKNGRPHHVTVFVMHVTGISDVWPERGRRRRSWLQPARALSRIDRPGLRQLMRSVLAAEPVTAAG
jgi:8-oxo-dGTP pyrophosphatase MutT (NUDIX family)